MAITEIQLNNFIYNEINKKQQKKYAIEKKCIVTSEDIKRGWINRYFLRQVNNESARILEIDKQQYNNFKFDPFYINITFRWKITGIKQNIYDINLKVLYDVDSEFPGILNKLKNNLLEYYSEKN